MSNVPHLKWKERRGEKNKTAAEIIVYSDLEKGGREGGVNFCRGPGGG